MHLLYPCRFIAFLAYHFIRMTCSVSRVYDSSLYVRKYAHSAAAVLIFCCVWMYVFLQNVKYLVRMVLQLFAVFLPYFMRCFVDHYGPRFCYGVHCVFYLFLCATSCYFLVDEA